MELCRRVKLVWWVGHKDHSMLMIEIAGGLFALLFLAAAMTGIEGNEHR